jgi:hypothetical protein
LAFEKQVRYQFGSSVHFSPSPRAKEFFLVVSFSSTSFALTEESVGLALQCCLGGDRAGFRVYRLSDRRFQFFVASNKVGHFVYGLKDRVWPDFVCHFSLFRGEHPMITGFHNFPDSTWHSSEENVVVAQQSPTKLNPSLHLLRSSAHADVSGNSIKELAKFGFNRSDLFEGSSSSSASSSSKIQERPLSSNQDGLLFGSFKDPIHADDSKSLPGKFIGSNFNFELCKSLPYHTLLEIQDLQLAGYASPEIMDILNLPNIPPKNLVNQFISAGSHAGLDRVLVSCSKCLDSGHMASGCTIGWRCRSSKQIGHLAHQCKPKHMIWRVKSQGPTIKAQRKQTRVKNKIWVVKGEADKKGVSPPTSSENRGAVSSLPLPQAIVQSPSAAMATFPVNLLAFLPEGMTIDHGPADRKPCIDLVLSSNAPLLNDKVVIAETNRFVPIHLRQQFSEDLRGLLEESGYVVSAFDDHPFGLGSYTF